MSSKLVLALSVAVCASAALAQSSPVTPGQWEIAVTVTAMEMPDMPPAVARMMVGRTNRFKQCITAADAARGPQDMLKSSKSCTFTRYTAAGGRLDSEMTCGKGKSVMTATSSGTYTTTSFTATGRSVTAGGPTVSTSTTGRRIGDCG